MRIWRVLGIVVVSLLVIGSGVIWFVKRPILTLTSVDERHLPPLIQADFIDLNRVASISKFRSGSGHDFSTGNETCRSMKHYFMPPFQPGHYSFYQPGDPPPPAPDPTTATAIMSPVDGRIVSIASEHTPIGQQFTIIPTSNTHFRIRLFHIYPADGIKAGMKVTAGQRIGSIYPDQGTDIAVEVSTLTGDQFVSYFQIMPDSVFAAYQARGIASRDELVISQEYRDAHPYQCQGEQFAQNYQSQPNYPDVVYLTGSSASASPPVTVSPGAIASVTPQPTASTITAQPTPSATSTPKTTKNTSPTTSTSSSDSTSLGWRDELTNLDSNRFQASAGWSNGPPFQVGWRADHVTFANGQLTLRLDDQGCPNDCSSQPYASAEYRTKDFYGYGRVEARLKPAADSGLVAGSLFTYTGPSDGQPHDEIDIEFLGKDTTKLQTNYYTADAGEHETLIDLGFDAAAAFHTYAFAWSPTAIQWFVDGQLVHTETGARGTLPTHPGRIITNLWAGSNVDSWLGPFSYSGQPIMANYDWLSFTPLTH